MMTMTAKINGEIFDVEVEAVFDAKNPQPFTERTGVLIRLPESKKTVLVPFQSITFVEHAHNSRSLRQA